MPIKSKPLKTDKFVFVIESDPVRQSEIKEALSHQQNWMIVFFSSPEACLQSLHQNPMVIFLDIEHFGADNNLNKGYALIAELHKKSHKAEVIVFAEADKEDQAAMALKKGAMDYIVINQHQFTKMESELNWIEKVHDQQTTNKKEKRFMLIMIFLLVGFIGVLLLLNYLGILKESTSPDVLIGD